MTEMRPSGSAWQWTGAALFVAVAGLYCFSAPTADNDLWGHVFFGRQILETRALPRTNTYSYTAPDYPWINHEILAECAFSATFEALGSRGLLALKLLLALATLALMAKTSAPRAATPLVWAGTLVGSASLMSWGYLIRPQIFTFLGLAAVWERVLAHDRTRDWRSLVALPLAFAVWVNTHGGVLAGLGIFLAYLAIPILTPRCADRWNLCVLAALSLAALALNPYGVELPRFLLWDVWQPRTISEWLPIRPFDSSALLFKSAVLVLVVSAARAPRERRWEVLFVALAAIATFRHQRHLPLFAIVSAPYLTETLDGWWRSVRDRLGLQLSTPFATSLLAAGAAAVAAFELVRVVAIHRGLGFEILVSPSLYPVDAVRFIERNQLAGNVAVPFDWGEYAIWHLWPRCRVSIDGRYTTAYPQPVLDASGRFDTGVVGWDDFLADADVAVIDRRKPIVVPMLQKTDWQDVYSDQTALVFVRRSVAQSRSFRREWRTEPESAFFFP